MTAISWDQTGERRFETGLDRGVLYPDSVSGVAWNGLIGVNDNTSGGEATPYFADGVKYANVPDGEDFSGTIEAYTYPVEFELFDGYEEVYAGVFLGQQERNSFGMSYRTKVGNDVEGADLGYKLHLLYNVLVSPAERNHATQSDDPEAMTFSWDFTTTPINFGMGTKPMAHIVFDSTKINSLILAQFEEILYGTPTSSPRILTPYDIISLFETILPGYFGIDEDPISGINLLVAGGGSDLKLSGVDGLYLTTPASRLVEDETGLYTLEG